MMRQHTNNKRNFSGELVNQNYKKDVYVPFRIHVPMGTSTFELSVPAEFKDRDFYFSYLVLVPEFYSEQAQVLDLDSKEELDEIFTYEVYMKIDYEQKDKLYPGNYVPGILPTTLQALMIDINNYFEIKKAVGTKHLGFFMDWTDVRYEEHRAESWDEFVRDYMALAYYGEPFDMEKHFNKLPPSARDVRGANNYLFPLKLPAVTLENIRFRINIAPNTRVIFSNPRQLAQFGFGVNQIGTPNRRSQYEYPNEETMRFVRMTADNEPTDIIIKVISDLKIYLQVNHIFYVTNTDDFTITKRNTFKNDEYETSMRNILQEFAKTSNINVEFEYNKQSKKFEFKFPDNLNFKNLNIVLPIELAYRMGFGVTNVISKENKIGEKVDDEPDVAHIQEKARALAYDTSVVVVSDDSTSSNTTSGISEKFMAALYPTNTGSLEISESEVCLNPPTMKLPNYNRSTSTHVPVTFKLSRFLDNSQLINLIWKNGAFVFGILRGVASEI